MDTHGNMARWIRAATETLGEYAEEYDNVGLLEERDEINDVREALGRLHRLPDPVDTDEYDDDDPAEDDDPDGAVDFEPSPDPNWMNP